MWPLIESENGDLRGGTSPRVSCGKVLRLLADILVEAAEIGGGRGEVVAALDLDAVHVEARLGLGVRTGLTLEIGVDHGVHVSRRGEIPGLVAARRAERGTPVSSRASVIGISRRIDSGTTLALSAGVICAVSCSAFVVIDGGTRIYAGWMLSAVLLSSPTCFAIAARPADTVSMSGADPPVAL